MTLVKFPIQYQSKPLPLLKIKMLVPDVTRTSKVTILMSWSRRLAVFRRIFHRRRLGLDPVDQRTIRWMMLGVRNRGLLGLLVQGQSLEADLAQTAHPQIPTTTKISWTNSDETHPSPPPAPTPAPATWKELWIITETITPTATYETTKVFTKHWTMKTTKNFSMPSLCPI